MAVKVHIPTPLRPFVNNNNELELPESETIGRLLQNLATEHPGLKKHLFNETGEIRNFVNIYINDEDIRYQKGAGTALRSGDIISIVPSIAGGSQQKGLDRFDRRDIKR